MSNFRISLWVMCFCISVWVPAAYAEQQDVASDPATASSADEAVESDKKEDEILEIERIAKLETILKADKKDLKDLKKSLSGRESILKLLQNALNMTKKRMDMQKELLAIAQESGETEEAATLEKAVSEDESDYYLIAGQTQLAFEAKKTVKHQIELIKNSIIKKQQTLDELKGVKKRVIVVPQQTPASGVGTAMHSAQEGESASPSALQIMLPGMPSVTSGSGVTPSTHAPGEKLQTAEQVEARKQAEKSTREALEAEQVATDYIEQSSALIERVKTDEKILETDRQSLSNFKKILLILEKRLREGEKNREDKAVLNKIKKNIRIVKDEIKKLGKEIASRSVNIEDAQGEMVSLREDQELLAEEAQKKREQAEKAQEHVVWLQSPLHPKNLIAWAYTRGPRVLMVLIFMAVLLFINRITARKISRVMARKSTRTGDMSQNRADTLALSLRGAVRVVIVFGGTILALQEAGVDIKTVLGGAAILGVAVAFGAQNLMRDYFNGLMILLEDQYELSDIVTINNITGTVERVSMRSTMLRDLKGQAHFIPNGSITHVTNATFEWARAVMEVPVAYKENVDQVMSVIMELANGLRNDSEFSADILDDPVMLGVNSFAESAVNIKFMLQTKADRMWPVQREMLRRIKNRFDELGIEFAHPQRIISQYAPVVDAGSEVYRAIITFC